MKKRLTSDQASAAPDIYLSRPDYEVLSRLVGDRQHDGIAGLLQQELERANVVEVAEMPSGVIGLDHWLSFTDDRSTTPRRVQIVLPGQANIDEGLISVLSHIGVGLLGLIEGQSIRWSDPSGAERTLTAVGVETKNPLS